MSVTDEQHRQMDQVKLLGSIDSAVERYGDTIVQLLNLTFEAVRALKPAPFAQPIEKVYRAALEEHAEQRAEIESLQAKVADQALTIGALKDANGRLGQRYTDHDTAELKRFRERECVRVEPLLNSVVDYFKAPSGEKKRVVRAAIAAVRDFKVTDV
jgi:hypothetical protein